MVTYKKHLDIELFTGEMSNTHQYPWHFHDSFTIVLVDHGSVSYNFHSHSITLSENEILIIAPFEAHSNIISKNTKYKAIFLPEDYLEPLTHLPGRLLTQKLKCSRLAKLFIGVSQEMGPTATKDEIRKTISRMYYLLDQYIGLINQEDTKGNIFNERLRSIKRLDYKSNINSLAHDVNLSKFHFQREFKKTHGLTVGQFKQQQKTIEAKTLLEQGLKSTDVAHRLGYFDQSHFIKYFKKMWALLPKEI